MLAARTGMSPYQAISTSSVPTLVPSPTQESRRSLIASAGQNGWNYSSENSVVSHATCSFPPYSLAASVPGGPKPTYTYGTDFLPNCQQMGLAVQNPLNSLPPRNFPFYGEMYHSNQAGMPGSGLFPDLQTIPSIPRFGDNEPGSVMTDHSNTSPGKFRL